MFWLYLLYYVLLLLVSLVGLALGVLGLPGLWLMVAACAIYAVATGGSILAWQTVVVIALLAVASEVVEFVASAAGSKTAGGTWRGLVGAVMGGLAGGLIGVPVPIVGPVLGAILGAAVGAGLLELSDRNTDLRRAGQVAIGAAKGRAVGVVSKLGFGSLMLLLAAVYAFPRPGELTPSATNLTSLGPVQAERPAEPSTQRPEFPVAAYREPIERPGSLLLYCCFRPQWRESPSRPPAAIPL